MITAHDVNAVTFEKAMRGYRADEVDKILDEVAAQLQTDEAELVAQKKVAEDLKKENADLKKAADEQKENMYLLAQKIEEYRADEENLKSALINAQRMGENVIREAKQKADGILRDAALRADEITRNAQQENAEELLELQRVKAEVAQFKADVLSLYKRHIESLSTLPEEEPAEVIDLFADDEMQEDDAEAFAVVSQQEEALVAEEVLAVEAVIETPVAPVVPETVYVAPVAQVESPVPAVPQEAPQPAPSAVPATPELTEQEIQASLFWSKDESELKEATPASVQETAPVFEAFKGIKFSD